MLRHAFRLAGAATVFACLLASQAVAQPLDKRTLFTFSGPIALPGVTLPAGQYMFRLADPSSRIVQVLAADGTRLYGMFFSIPAERFDPADVPEVRFMETAADVPPAIRTWWYPGDRRGFEFVYPKEQARRLAQGTTQPVLTTVAESTTAAETETGDLARVGASGDDATVPARTEPTVGAPEGERHTGEIASEAISVADALSATGPAAEGAATAEARTSLPATASNAPAAAMAGALALVAAAGLWYWRRRRA